MGTERGGWLGHPGNAGACRLLSVPLTLPAVYLCYMIDFTLFLIVYFDFHAYDIFLCQNLFIFFKLN